ncbi:MAG TPA: NAD(P)H-hydrate dehydratase, partial [Hellea balneolensis]|nr:NAD(P)H-hydrate dehydratase [Hellea balneolensis]
IGPGGGLGPDLKAKVLASLSTPLSCILDADALSTFSENSQSLFKAIRSRKAETVLTPHHGEFTRLFTVNPELDKITNCQNAAKTSGAIVVYKGADTVIAAPDGRVSINTNGPPCLATAGAGDVLSGLIGGLCAQGLDAYNAARAGCWIHGAAGAHIGPGLIASDIICAVPDILAEEELCA